MKKLFQLVQFSLFVVTVWLIYSAIEIIAYAAKDQSRPSDVAIVLGSEAVDDGASSQFEQNFRHAIDLYMQGTVDKIILTGGIGTSRTCADSGLACFGVLAKAIPDKDIYIAAKASSTWQNLLAARKILKRKSLKSALLVSAPLHMKRAITMAQDARIRAYTSPSRSIDGNLNRQLAFLLREIYYYNQYMLTGS